MWSIIRHFRVTQGRNCTKIYCSIKSLDLAETCLVWSIYYSIKQVGTNKIIQLMSNSFQSMEKNKFSSLHQIVYFLSYYFLYQTMKSARVDHKGPWCLPHCHFQSQDIFAQSRTFFNITPSLCSLPQIRPIEGMKIIESSVTDIDKDWIETNPNV